MTTRREFLLTSAAVAGAAMVNNAYAGGSDVIKVGLIGCGGRGSGAADQVLHSSKGVELVAIGDVFKVDERERGVEPCRERLLKLNDNERVKKLGNKVDLPESRCFVGLNAYQDVLNAGVDLVILATPPGFRPLHLQAA